MLLYFLAYKVEETFPSNLVVCATAAKNGEFFITALDFLLIPEACEFTISPFAGPWATGKFSHNSDQMSAGNGIKRFSIQLRRKRSQLIKR